MYTPRELRDLIIQFDHAAYPRRGLEPSDRIDEAANLLNVLIEQDKEVCVIGQFSEFSIPGSIPEQVCGDPRDIESLMQRSVEKRGADSSTSNLTVDAFDIVAYDIDQPIRIPLALGMDA